MDEKKVFLLYFDSLDNIFFNIEINYNIGCSEYFEYYCVYKLIIGLIIFGLIFFMV